MNTIIQYLYTMTTIINTNKHITINNLIILFIYLVVIVLLLMFYLCFCANIRHSDRLRIEFVDIDINLYKILSEYCK